MKLLGLSLIAVAGAVVASCATAPTPAETCQAFAARHSITLGAPDESDWIADTTAFQLRWAASGTRPAVTCSIRDGRVLQLNVGDQVYRRDQ